MNELVIRVRDPLAEFLGGPGDVAEFELSVLDAARLSGHLCPTVAGAFLGARAAIHALFPDTGVCVRGEIEIDLPGRADEGVTGPISHVLSFITGAWDASGFKGLGKGRFSRRNLLHFGSSRCEGADYRFERRDTGAVVLVFYHPERAEVPAADGEEDFADGWQRRVRGILSSRERVIEIKTG